MPNMSYCRFENTARDLADCLEHIGDNLSESEHKSRQKLVELCEEIVKGYDKALEKWALLYDDEGADEDEDEDGDADDLGRVPCNNCLSAEDIGREDTSNCAMCGGKGWVVK